MRLCFRRTKRKTLYAVALFSNMMFCLRYWPFSWPFASSGVSRGLLGPMEDVLRAQQANRGELSDAENFDHSYDFKYEGLFNDMDSLRTFGSFSCSQLFMKTVVINKTAVEAKNNYLKSRIPHDAAFHSLAENCTKFTSERYFKYNVTQEELDFPLAYGIYMYKSVRQVELLLRTIYRPHNVYCIHIDRKASLHVHKSMRAIAKCFDNVFVASRLARVTWCSIEVVRAELYCLSDLLKRPEKWKYYLNLSGQEFPLKTNLEIVQILKEYHGLSDVMSSSLRTSPERQKFKYFINKGEVVNSTLPHTLPKPFAGPIFKGELHVALSRQFVGFILYTKVGQTWFTWLNESLCPDEYFYQTLSRLPGVPGVLGRNVSGPLAELTRAKIWQGSVSGDCQGKLVRQICVYSWRDLPYLATRPQLFANKFHADYDSVVLECLSELIQNRTNNPIKLNLPFYRNFSTFRSWESVTNQKNWILRDESKLP
ncbi:beta-1,3-galactosyl-O-glycosyl-glycoprotein beta-1,6-N-acetylglucosaminyltransferase-like [Ptychodera flava]|uniref:beta-1,3-galactosyl-O-glycosyl-glycoprotein beta-1,6-N-acetylglucosaminyltransferase-like n=1 Tax=Ptychodera flava TaxID=63121 RepID=UPI003969FA2D